MEHGKDRGISPPDAVPHLALSHSSPAHRCQLLHSGYDPGGAKTEVLAFNKSHQSPTDLNTDLVTITANYTEPLCS